MDPVTPQEAADFFEGAPEVAVSQLTLATVWASGELALRRVGLDHLGAEQRQAVRMAIAAKALALRAGVTGVVGLRASASNAKVVESVEVVDEIKVKFRAAVSADELVTLETGQWSALAESLLQLALPVAHVGFIFPGAAR